MRKLILGLVLIGCISCQQSTNSNHELAKVVAQDTLLTEVKEMARETVKRGFSAGDGYREVW
ncbi:MAG TPA: hypothetical protein H9825_13550, partial [Candidatus Sphingobacterium stercorigallinarum]|nr:hypothetical protein [Candidatus Sphingobacterium stercorigallinarum]